MEVRYGIVVDLSIRTRYLLSWLIALLSRPFSHSVQSKAWTPSNHAFTSFYIEITTSFLMIHWRASNSAVSVSESIIDWSSTIMAIFNSAIFQWNFNWVRIQWSPQFVFRLYMLHHAQSELFQDNWKSLTLRHEGLMNHDEAHGPCDMGHAAFYMHHPPNSEFVEFLFPPMTKSKSRPSNAKYLKFSIKATKAKRNSLRRFLFSMVRWWKITLSR